MFERILVPLDGSVAAEGALAFVELIPSRSIRLLTIDPDESGPMLASAPETDAWRAKQREVGETYLSRVAAPLERQAREIELMVAFGDAAERIIEIAADVDLIVMGSHGRGAGGRIAFGSVADRVARHAPAPVLVVRGGSHPTAPPPVARLVVPLDGSDRAETAIAMATVLAEILGIPMHLVRVVSDELPRATVQAGLGAAAVIVANQLAINQAAELYLSDAVQQLRGQDYVVTSELRTGHPATELLQVVQPGDLIVLTSHGRGGVRRWLLGSVAEKLVRLAPAPVLLMRVDQTTRAIDEVLGVG